MTARLLRATGAVLASSALVLAGLAAPAAAQTKIPTTWTPGQFPDGTQYNMLTKEGATTAIPDATGIVSVQLILGPRASRFYDLVGVELPVTELEFPYGDEPILVPSLRDDDLEGVFVEVLREFADEHGDYGEYGMDITYLGDTTYARSNTLAERITFAAPAGKIIPTSTLTVAPGGQMSVTIDPAISGTGFFDCRPLSEYQNLPGTDENSAFSAMANLDDEEDDEPLTIPVTNGNATGQCLVGDPNEPHVMGFSLAPGTNHTAHVNAMLFIPSAGGTTAGLDPDADYAPGQQVSVSATGLDRDSQYEVEVQSSPVVVGTLTTDSNGNGSTTVTLPEGLTDGIHHLILRKGGTEAVRHEIKVSAMADPSKSASIALQPGGDPGGPNDPGGDSGSLGSLTGSLGS